MVKPGSNHIGIGAVFRWVELDAVNVVKAVQAPTSSLGVTGFVISDIVALCADVQVSKCQAIPRSGNTLAHNLASAGFSSQRDWWWQDTCQENVPFAVH